MRKSIAAESVNAPIREGEDERRSIGKMGTGENGTSWNVFALKNANAFYLPPPPSTTLRQGRSAALSTVSSITPPLTN
jgi:hypothetical protein